jgi:uncharacterized protein
MAGKSILTRNSKGQYHFVLKAANGETIGQSEMYSSKAAAKNRAANLSQRGRAFGAMTLKPVVP